MFIVLLKFSDNKSQAGSLMEGHNQWIGKGFEDGVFLMVGSIQSGQGGAVVAQGESREAIERRVAEDPFVAENVVTAEIIEVDPKKTDDRLGFLVN